MTRPLDTATVRAHVAVNEPAGPALVLALCDALDAATARAEAAERRGRDLEGALAASTASHVETRDERDRARGTAAALEAELAEIQWRFKGASW